MNLLYSIPVFLMATVLLSLSTFSSSHELVYGQQEQNQIERIDIHRELGMNLTLGNPLYTEKFTVPKLVKIIRLVPLFIFR